MFDDFEALFFSRMMDIIRENLEMFGFTQSVVLDPRLVIIPQGAQYDNARGSGIITTNVVEENLEVIAIERDELTNYLSTKSLRTRIHNLRLENKVATLPIYIAYREERNYIWNKETEAFDVVVPQGEFVYGKDEIINKWTTNYV